VTPIIKYEISNARAHVPRSCSSCTR